jgi:long-chain acyl-CoA synthetase
LEKREEENFNMKNENKINKAGKWFYSHEIENILKTDSRIIDIQVKGINFKGGGHLILLLIITKTMSREDVINICKSKLPSEQMPDIINFVAEIPKSTYNEITKIERK